MLWSLCILALSLPLAYSWVSPAASPGSRALQLPLRGPATEQRQLIGSNFVGASLFKQEATVAGRGKSSDVSPVMMGRAAAKRAATKGKTDAAKTKLNARYGKMVTMCVKAGGPDLIANPQLGKLMLQAKQAGVPVANMENIIKRATSKDVADYKESTYEVYGLGGIGFVIDILTDNNNRAAGDVRTVLNRNKLKMAEPGSVSFNFDRLGCVTVATDKHEDTMTEAALNAGAEDLEAIDTETHPDAKSGFNIYTSPTDLMSVSDGIKEQGFDVTDARFIWKPKAPMECAEEEEDKNLTAIEMLEELDDVDAVWHNMS